MTASEWLRAVARRGGDESTSLDALDALAAYGGDSAALVVACRRLLAHRGCDAPLWWLCSSLLTAVEPSSAARRMREELLTDRTAHWLDVGLAAREGVVAIGGWSSRVDDALSHREDLEVVAVRLSGADPARALRWRSERVRVRVCSVEALVALPVSCCVIVAQALDPTRALVPAGSSEMLAAFDSSPPAWVLGGVGQMLAAPVFTALLRCCESTAVEVLDLGTFDRVVGPRGIQPVEEAARGIDCPVAAELLR